MIFVVCLQNFCFCLILFSFVIFSPGKRGREEVKEQVEIMQNMTAACF